LLFVYLPQYERYSHPWLASPYRERILSLVKNLGLEIIDLHESFSTQSDPLSLFALRRPGHYDIPGNRLVAGAILSRLIQERTITPVSRPE
jgi:hypothetical protein